MTDPHNDLRSEHTETRRNAVVALRDVPQETAMELVMLGLGDRDWRVRKEAVWVTAELYRKAQRSESASPATDASRRTFADTLLNQLIDALCQSDNVGLRNSALEALTHVGPDASAQLIAAIGEVPPAARKFVIEALGAAGGSQAAQILSQAAEGSDPNSAASALEALTRLGGPVAESTLRKKLAAPDPFQRMAALDGLARLDAVVPWQELVPLLHDRLLHRAALRVLSGSGSPKAVDPLVQALDEGSPSLSASAASGVARLVRANPKTIDAFSIRLANMKPSSRESLRTLLHGSSERARQEAALLLTLARDLHSLQGIVRVAAEGIILPSALIALARWGVDAIAPLLDLFDNHDSMRVRAHALELAADIAAQNADHTRAIDQVRQRLRRALSSENPELQLSGARGLTIWAQPEDAKPLVDLCRNTNDAITRASAEALCALARTAQESVAESLVGITLKGTAGAALANVFAEVGGDTALEQLQAGLADEDPAVRKSCLDALARIGAERAAEIIGFALADEDVDVRTSAARALGQLRDSAGRPVGGPRLLLALQSDTPAVQAAAARALGQTGDASAAEPLRELVRNPYGGVAVAALEALRQLRDPVLDAVLVEALGHADEEVVKESLRAIASSNDVRAVARLAVGLEHGAWHVRALAAQLLGIRREDAARNVLLERDRVEVDHMVQAAIRAALEQEL